MKSVIIKEIIHKPKDSFFWRFYDKDKNIVDEFATEYALETLYKIFFVDYNPLKTSLYLKKRR